MRGRACVTCRGLRRSRSTKTACVPRNEALPNRTRQGCDHQSRGYDSLRVSRKGGPRDALAINPQTPAHLRAYLEASGHGADVGGPLFRPLHHNGKRWDERRGMVSYAIDRVVRKYAGELGLDRGDSALSMRATFITTTLENGAQLGDVQKAAGHRDPGTTKLYDRRGYNPEKAASFFATC
jgi:integrase/recombinase XerD